MIIKEKPIKSYVALDRTLRYILSKEVAEGFVHTYYIKGDRRFKKEWERSRGEVQAHSILLEQRLNNMLKEYTRNDTKRIHKRKRETKFHHTVLSFHKKDTLSREELLQTAKEYIKQRYPKSLVCAVSHHDTNSKHIHLVGSHVQLGTGITNYHTKQQFADIKQYMEAWQEQHLQLEYSKIEHVKKKDHTLVKDAEYQINLRGKQTEKQQLQMILSKAYSQAKSPKQFYALLEKQGLKLYFRNHQPGIIGKRKYRLKTLGFSLERIQLLELEKKQQQKQLTRLAQLRKKESPQQDRDLEQEL